MFEKYPRLKQEGVKAFVDPEGYKAYVAEREQVFRAELAKQSRKTK
jgi:metallo-beta-lactamase class B